MRPHRFAACLTFVAQASWATSPEPMHSAACHEALAQLQAREAAAASSPTATDLRARTEPARRAAARACLGGTGEAPQPAHTAQPAIRVPSAVQALPRAPLPAAKGPAPARAEPLRSITSCDANGCWASDGTRLQRSPAGLLGPGGYCSVQGSVLHCP
jgi:hypothetical protein